MEAHNNLGFLYWQDGRLTQATAELETAVTLDPAWPTALVNLALAYYAQGQMDDARRMAERAVNADSRSARAHYVAGLILLSLEDANSQALKHLREARVDFPKAQLMEAYLMLRLNRPDQARQTLHTYLMSTPLR